MAYPNVNELLLPVLEILGDGKNHDRIEIIDLLSKRFNLTQEERDRTSGNNNLVFGNLIDFVRNYFTQHQLIETPTRGNFHITKCGQYVLRHHASALSIQFLNSFRCASTEE
jgi:restriction system protein